MPPVSSIPIALPWSPPPVEPTDPSGPGTTRPPRMDPMMGLMLVMAVLSSLLQSLAPPENPGAGGPGGPAGPSPAGPSPAGAPGGNGNPFQDLLDSLSLLAGEPPKDPANGPSNAPSGAPSPAPSTARSDRPSDDPSSHCSDHRPSDERPDRQRKADADHPSRGANERELSKTPPSDKIPAPTGTVVVNEPIVVKAGQTFDGGGKLYQAGRALGDGGQSEDQQPVFILEKGATLKNAQVAGADGVHAYGDAQLKDVWWRDVGEDAFTLKAPGHVTVEGGGAFNATDKVFQINAAGSLSIDGFYAENFGKLVRQNGGTHFALDVSLDNVVTRGGHESLVRTDSSSSTVSLNNVDPGSVKHVVIAPDGER